MPVTYANYLKVQNLLDLQTPLSAGPEHDETLFIIIHQVYELWFKQILHEFDLLLPSLQKHDDVQVQLTFKRILTILKTMVGQVDILETMTPVSFASFRSRLDTASGFQSAQFREVEFILGNKSMRVFDHYPAGTAERSKLERRYAQNSLMDCFVHYLKIEGFAVPQELMSRDVTTVWQPNQALQKILIEIYKKQHKAMFVCERMVDIDEGLQEWRYRHVKMVERTIGAKMGTGGSAGADYLKNTLFRPAFPDLWAIRVSL